MATRGRKEHLHLSGILPRATRARAHPELVSARPRSGAPRRGRGLPDIRAPSPTAGLRQPQTEPVVVSPVL